MKIPVAAKTRTHARTPWRAFARGSRRRGQSVVEFALLVPVLLALVMGIIEFGWLTKNQLTLSNAAREGARTASLGHTTTDIRTRIVNAAAPLDVSANGGSITMLVSSDNGATYPTTLTDSGSENSASSGKLIKITVSARNNSLTGFFPFLRNRIITVKVAMRREA